LFLSQRMGVKKEVSIFANAFVMRSANTKFFFAQSVMQNAVHIGNFMK
jgi:hypothetical protein